MFSHELSTQGSLDLFEFLQGAQIGGMRPARVDLRPGGPGDLADIDVAVPIDRQPVRRQKLAELGTGRGVAKPADQFALMVDDRNPRPEIGNVAADRCGGPHFADVADRLMPIGMYMPHGRCRFFHWVSYLPLPSNT